MRARSTIALSIPALRRLVRYRAYLRARKRREAMLNALAWGAVAMLYAVWVWSGVP